MTGQWADGVLAAVNSKRGIKAPIYGFVDWVVEEIWESWDDRETQL